MSCQHRDDGRGRCIDCSAFLDTWDELPKSVALGIELLDELHEEMARGNGVHPFDIFDRIGVIIAVLKGETDEVLP